MVRDWPGITDKAAFCAWLTHEQTGQWPAEKDLAKFGVSVPVAKADSDKGLVTGWAALSSAYGKPVVDYHDELIPIDELEKAAHDLMLAGGEGRAGEMHDQRVGDVVESLVLDEAKAKALGIDGIDKEGWIVTLKIKDPSAHAKVQVGSLRELSIHGTARKVAVGKRDGRTIHALSSITVDEISLVDRGASGNEDAAPEIVIAKRRDSMEQLDQGLIKRIKHFFSKGKDMSLDEVLGALPEDQRNVILAALEEAKKGAQPEQQPPAEPVEEKLPEAVAKRLAEADELKKRLAKIEDEKLEASMLSKAKELEHLPGCKTEDLSKALVRVSKGLSKEDFELVTKLLTSANEIAKANPMLGSSGSSMGGEGNAHAKLEGIAKKLQETDPTLTAAKAYNRAGKLNPELWAQARGSK